ncbi:hypothetical protein GF386_02015 [Candidatus Pacearchaeota archaeon]|nr:hypothetical protein [Candidatus Pacearchaeota archaeon]MBD3282949.1 hypothetical protein [Candidatus Pacearchaeota archaeon]
MKQNELFSYAYDFVSQLVENKPILDSIRRIILFGSVARGDFSQKSDVDLFIDLKDSGEEEKIKEIIRKEINKFEGRSEKTWFLRGINLPIKVVIGDIEKEKWKDLKEEILAYGKIIYGKFQKTPEKLEHRILIMYDLKKLSQKRKMSLIRELYGYTTKKSNKKYIQKGFIEKIESKKISPNTLIIRAEDLLKLKQIFKKYRLKYQLVDVWMK